MSDRRRTSSRGDDPGSYGAPASSSIVIRQMLDVPVRYPGPLQVVPRPILIKSAETTKILGPRYANIATGSDNIYTTGKGCVVDPTDGTYDIADEVDVDTSQIGDALVFPTGDESYPLAPQYTFWSVQIGSVYYAIAGGTKSFPATVDSAYSANIYYVLQDSPYTGDMTAAESLFDEALIDTQSVLVSMVGNRPTITHAGCVP